MQVILQIAGLDGRPEELVVDADSEEDALRTAALRGMQVLSVSLPAAPICQRRFKSDPLSGESPK